MNNTPVLLFWAVYKLYFSRWDTEPVWFSRRADVCSHTLYWSAAGDVRPHSVMWLNVHQSRHAQHHPAWHTVFPLTHTPLLFVVEVKHNSAEKPLKSICSLQSLVCRFIRSGVWNTAGSFLFTNSSNLWVSYLIIQKGNKLIFLTPLAEKRTILVFFFPLNNIFFYLCTYACKRILIFFRFTLV